MFSADDRRQAVQDENDLTELNRLLNQAGTIADRLSYRGYEVMMTLWHEDRGSVTVRGRLQGNVSKVSLREKQ